LELELTVHFGSKRCEFSFYPIPDNCEIMKVPLRKGTSALPIRLIAMDIDGTLLDSQGKLPEPNVTAITRAAEAGAEIVLVTGRRFDFARGVSDGIPCDLTLITSNGAVIKSKSGETHQRVLLARDTARAVLDAAAEFRPEAGVVFDRPHASQLVLEKINWDDPVRGGYFRRNREHIAEVAPLTECFNGEDPVQVMFVGACDRMRWAKSLLVALPIAENFTVALTEYSERNLSMLDVLRSGVTKASGLAEWARRRGIPRDEVMAIGDNFNDREMLAYSGLPIVMGNSVPELKSAGWEVTLSNDECGVAFAIQKHVLGITSDAGVVR
jgi:Cof subfamily protein (haloacid dehalogenase superfamily)